MAKCKVLAFLLCEKATKGRDGKVTLHGLFDRIIIPRTPRGVKLFYVYYKIVAEGACTVSLRVLDSSGQEIPGNWRDSFSHFGPVQSIWALVSSLFKLPGNYVLELRQEIEGSEPYSLADMLFAVDEEDE
jgi:Family of unknown function (DUF6941)